MAQPLCFLTLRSRIGQRVVEFPNQASFTLGRHEADVTLHGESTSRSHARVSVQRVGEATNVYIRDLGSSHGTYVGCRDPPHKLQKGEVYLWKNGETVVFGRWDLGTGEQAVLEIRRPARTAEAGVAEQGQQSRYLHRLRPQEDPPAKRRQADQAPQDAVQGTGSPPTGIKKNRYLLRAGGQDALQPMQDQADPPAQPQMPPRKQALTASRYLLRATHLNEKPKPLGSEAKTTFAPASRCSPASTADETKQGKQCDKCDGLHATAACPHFKHDREDHKDAWVNYGNKHPMQMGSSGGDFLLRNAQVVRQPGDGSCLYHSLAFGLDEYVTGHQLRRQLALFVYQNPGLTISGDTVEEWVRWDSGLTCQQYAKRQALSGWGGGIEIAACSILKRVNVHVYECRTPGNTAEYKRISCFDFPQATKTIHILYMGGMHFDALRLV
eukprot:TRINITY_DN57297_c0_g1_i1.p1 TRINITY_DN57297_c0_g1~~TRINITY_DN57297_c0_g1_i1.p1  ORF type:complete len:440 (-),score=59.17 TRINITY_DN57297_c0_g1_i1:57-1376(-)